MDASYSTAQLLVVFLGNFSEKISIIFLKFTVSAKSWMQFQTCINLSQRHWLICASTIVLFCAMITGKTFRIESYAHRMNTFLGRLLLQHLMQPTQVEFSKSSECLHMSVCNSKPKLCSEPVMWPTTAIFCVCALISLCAKYVSQKCLHEQ